MESRQLRPGTEDILEGRYREEKRKKEKKKDGEDGV
jgi:hypothetical protein